MKRTPWNHNIHYQSIALKNVPPHAETALDVGFGDGLLMDAIARQVPSVMGIDSDDKVVSTAT